MINFGAGISLNQSTESPTLEHQGHAHTDQQVQQDTLLALHSQSDTVGKSRFLQSASMYFANMLTFEGICSLLRLGKCSLPFIVFL